MKKFKNTLRNGLVRCIIFREDNVYYAVALDFNIVESGDTPREAMLLLLEAIAGYVESARKIKARPYILNQKADSEYEEMWRRKYEQRFSQAKNIFFSGELNIGQVLTGSCSSVF